ncbi:hypothetical protein C5167_039935 [Papaver somniferum]|uniref:SAM-dependent MTase RsmB/NOP-type domain-containing protein n=1 Tax=Papaver somniferum TaxID=3469 RepID=A0A4Y7IH05_PAPSO|nr:hypothetical protein C5167_039935 [Papaver somniferum]
MNLNLSLSLSSPVSAEEATAAMGGVGRGGGQKRGRTQRKHFKQTRENVWKKTRSDTTNNNDNNNGENHQPGWESFANQNLAFEAYYKEQGIVKEEEWKVADGDEGIPVRPLPWYPNNMAWHSNFSRMQLRKNQSLERFHHFLKQANDIGNITRQEAVSMSLLSFICINYNNTICASQVLEHHSYHVATSMSDQDQSLCAAPGSKTFQLLEIIHQSSDSALPTGLVIANDVDAQRCNLLIHQTKRMCCANLIVTNHEAQHFPSCNLSKNGLDTSEFGIPDISQLLFDRVLCDIPCSGDGTLRKAPDIWRKWSGGMGNGVHRLQILRRCGGSVELLDVSTELPQLVRRPGIKSWKVRDKGIALLKVGGRMVYSTCSMNPVENEAVVAEILRRCGESVELLDVSTELPQLVRRPGIKSWKVRDKGVWLASYKDVSKYRRTAIVPSMFPSGQSFDAETVVPSGLDENVVPPSNDNDMENVDSDHVNEQSEILVTVSSSTKPKETLTNGNHKLPLKVSDEVPRETNSAEPSAISNVESSDGKTEVGATGLNSREVVEEENEKEHTENVNAETDTKKAGGNRRLQNQGKWRGVDPVVFFREDTVLSSIKDFYGISDSFPLNDHLVTRNTDFQSCKRIYYISKSVQDVMKLNFQVGQQLKIISIVLKAFVRATNSKEDSASECMYRISSEGLPLLLPYISKQILCASLADFKHLLQYRSIKFQDFVNPQFGEKASSEIKLGCCIVVLQTEDQPTSKPMDASTIAIGCWRGKSSVSVMVPETDCQELLERLSARLGFEMVPVKEKPTVRRGKKDDAEEKLVKEPVEEEAIVG